jgi:hypothetical protein
MQTITLDLLTEKLKNAPQSVLERVFGYAEALVEPTSKPYSLTNEQQQQLDNQIISDKSKYVSAESLYSDLKSKYEL